MITLTSIAFSITAIVLIGKLLFDIDFNLGPW
jgi:hypothetical protein